LAEADVERVLDEAFVGEVEDVVVHHLGVGHLEEFEGKCVEDGDLLNLTPCAFNSK
jgi:hypothetical protein